jgi:general L-amino acid transport system substrate-binding protein
MRYQLALFDSWADAVKAYSEGPCTLLTGDLPSLADERSRLAAPGDHLLMPELVAYEPTGPFVRQGDDPWLTVVTWTLLALIEAEQINLTQSAVATEDISEGARVQRFLGKETALGGNLGLAPNWTERVVAEVGHYGEIYNRTLGEGSRLKLPRGANALWTNGGLMAAPQFR